MKKINNLLIIASLLCAQTEYAAQAEADRARYEEIVAHYDDETNNFRTDFIAHQNDIAILENHRKALEARRDEDKASWMPIILKNLGAGFGLDAAVGAAYSAYAMSFPLLPLEIHTLISQGLFYLEVGNPISYLTDKIIHVTIDPLYAKLYEYAIEQKQISNRTYSLILKSVPVGLSLVSAGISYYLFKKANSYKVAIKLLNKEIIRDANMIKLLQQK